MKRLKKVFTSKTMRLALRLMWDRKWITLALLACGLVSSLLSIVHPFAMQQFVDEGVVQKNKEVLIFSSLVFMLYPVVNLLLSGLNDSLEKELSAQVDMGLQGFLRRKLQKVSPLRLFHKYKPSELSGGLTEWTNGVSNSVSSVVPELLESLFKMVLALGAMWWINPLMTALCIMSVATLALVKRVLNKYTKLNQELFQLRNKLMGHTAEFVREFLVIQLYGASERENKEFDRLREEYQKIRKKTLWTKILGIDLLSSVTDAIITGIVLLGGMVFFETLSPGQAFQFISYVSTFQVGVKWFYHRYTSVLEMIPAVDRCDEVLYLEEVPTAPNAKQHLDEVKSIEFCKVTADYPGSEKPSIRDVSLTIRQGEKIALVGRSGSGKTTLTYLLGRLIEPISGKILLNGRPIEEYTLESIRAKFGFCLQETGMLNRTIAENLKIGAPGATDEQLHEALFCAGLEMKESYHDQASPGSGGQKQRLGVARVLLQNTAEVFVFDEFTSAVDKITEFQMLKRMGVWLSGKTQIIIAHRYSTIRDVDRVIVVDNGEIVQVGTLTELREQKDGLFYILWKEEMGANASPSCECSQKKGEGA